MKRFSGWLALVAAVSLLLGPACGGGGEDELPSAEEDKASAARMVLTQADLAGFTQEPPDEESGSDEAINKCVNNNPDLIAEPKPRGVEGPEFTKEQNDVTVNSGVFFTTSVESARKAFADFKAAFSGDCLTNEFRRVLEEDFGPDITVEQASLAPIGAASGADDAAASQLTLRLSGGGERITMYADISFFRSGRAIGGFSSTQVGSAFPEGERMRLGGLLARRLSGKEKNDGAPATVATTAAPATTAAGRSTTGTGDFTRYRSTNGVVVDHPDDWEVGENDEGVLLMFIDPPTGVPFRRTINILSQDFGQGATLDQYTELLLDEIRAAKDFVQEDAGPTTLSGFPAYRITYRADHGSGQVLRFAAVWTVRGDTGWQVTYSADPARFSTALPEFERLLTTVTLPA